MAPRCLERVKGQNEDHPLNEGVSHISTKSSFSKALGLAAPWVSLTGGSIPKGGSPGVPIPAKEVLRNITPEKKGGDI